MNRWTAPSDLDYDHYVSAGQSAEAPEDDPADIVVTDLDGCQRDILRCTTVDQALRFRAELSDLRATIERLESLALERADAICRERG